MRKSNKKLILMTLFLQPFGWYIKATLQDQQVFRNRKDKTNTVRISVILN